MRLPVTMLLAKSLSDHPVHSLPMMLRLGSQNRCLSWPLQSQLYSMEMYLYLDSLAVGPTILLGPLCGLEVGPMAFLGNLETQSRMEDVQAPLDSSDL